MEVFYEPLTVEEMKKRVDEDNYIKGIVPISLSEVIDTDFEGFLDIISENLTGRPTLMDVNYRIVGHENDNTLLIEVSGDASSIIEDDEY